MPITYSIAPNPHWVIIDNFSKLPIGAAIYTYSSKNPSVFKPAFQDASGNNPFPQPIVGFGNGTFPPIFWQFDSTAPDDLYYIRVYDKVNDPGNNANFLWDFIGLPSAANGGGGGSSTTNNDIDNLVVNGEFYRNIGNVVGSPSVSMITTIAPSNNAGLVANLSDPNGPASPDIIFAKSNTTSHDNITFTNFPNGASDLAPNPTPQFFVNYTSDNSGSESYKYFQFPIGKGVQNLSGQKVGIQIFARNNGGDPNVSLNIRQFFGNGPGASADVLTPVGILNFGAGWTRTLASSFVIPAISGASVVGSCGNDATFLQLAFPLSVAVNIDFILPSVYLGGIPSAIDFHSLDFVDAIVDSPRTGDVRTSLNSFSPYGWVPANDGTIGSPGSNATTRANIDTFPLFDLIWRTFQSNQALAPMYTAGGAPVVYGASSIIDFGTDNRQISLTRNTGRVMAGTVPIAISQTFSNVGNVMTVTSTASFINGTPVLISAPLPVNVLANVTYYAIVLSNTTMSIASTYADAVNPVPVAKVLGSNVVGSTVTAMPQHLIGSFLGEEQHLQLTAEVGPHVHPATSPGGQFLESGGVNANLTVGGGSGQIEPNTGANTPSGTPFNVMQPTVYMNIFIKL